MATIRKGTIILAALLALVAPARAEVVTISCTPVPEYQAMDRQVFEINVTPHAYRLISGGNDYRDYPVQISDHYYLMTGRGATYRVNRQTGFFEGYSHGTWSLMATCEKVEGNKF